MMQKQLEEERKRNALNKMMGLAERIEENAIETQKEVFGQGEKLTRIEDKTDQLDKETDKTKKLSRQIYSFWYYLKDKVAGKYKSEQPA